MAYRTTELAVQGIVKTKSSIDLDPFLEVANALVTKHCTDTNFTDAELELIERYLAAHFYCIRDPRAKRERANIVSRETQSRVDIGFDVTHYGQMAIRLDWSGALAALNQRAKKGAMSADVTWIGMTPTELSEYLETIE